LYAVGVTAQAGGVPGGAAAYAGGLRS